MATAGGPDAHVSYVGSDIFIAVSTLQCAFNSTFSRNDVCVGALRVSQTSWWRG